MDADLEKIIREYTDPQVHMSLATSENNQPWVCEVHFALDDKLNLYFRSLSRTRHCRQIAKNPNVAGNIVKQFALGELPFGVYFEGTAEQVTGEEAQKAAYEVMRAKLQTKPEALDQAKDPDNFQFHKITVANWYVFGKIGGSPPQKYQLVWNGGNR